MNCKGQSGNRNERRTVKAETEEIIGIKEKNCEEKNEKADTSGEER